MQQIFTTDILGIIRRNFKRIIDVNRQKYVAFMNDNPHIAKQKLVKVNATIKRHDCTRVIYAF